MAALQLCEEIREIHGEALPWFDMHIFATGAGKAALLSRRIQILKSDPRSPMLQRDPPRRVGPLANR
jgi:predicted ATPase